MAVPSDEKLRGLLERFTCVRVVQLWNVDLGRFQFDGALTWAVFFLNADGTIYGRYGSRSSLGKGSDAEVSLEGFKATLRAALAAHRVYVVKHGNKTLAGKMGTKPPWPVAQRIPTLKANPRFQERWDGTRDRKHGCIHCHMVPVNEALSLRQAGKPLATDRYVWPYPLPADLGFTLDPTTPATVKKVDPDSLAGKADLREGDDIMLFGGQQVLSQADVQWVLHQAGETARIQAIVQRKHAISSVELVLEKGWRRKTKTWRWFPSAWQRQILGFTVKEAAPEQRQALGLEEGRLLLRVDRINRQAGELPVRRGDLVLAIDGSNEARTEAEVAAYVLAKPVGAKVTLTRVRGDRKQDVEIRLR